MRCRSSAILSGIGCIFFVICAHGVTSRTMEIRYVNSLNQSRDEFHLVFDASEAFGWWHYLSQATMKREGLWEDFSSWELNNCSDDVYQCLIGNHRVFAVPRVGLKPHSVFSVSGAVLRVEKCLREQDDRCERALVSSDCHWIVSPDRCSDTQSDTTMARGPVFYFVFDANLGVMSYGSPNRPEEDVKAQAKIAREYRLKSPKGLFAPDIALPVRKQ